MKVLAVMLLVGTMLGHVMASLHTANKAGHILEASRVIVEGR